MSGIHKYPNKPNPNCVSLNVVIFLKNKLAILASNAYFFIPGILDISTTLPVNFNIKSNTLKFIEIHLTFD